MSKTNVTLVLSGEVTEDGISELWWDWENTRYRIFTNANFLYFTCGLDEFESETAHYSVFMMVTPRGSGRYSTKDKWRPSVSDFTSGGLEYLIVEPRESQARDKAGCDGIETMLARYADQSGELKLAYENRVKLQEAKRDYDAAHPRVEHDVIVNYAPLRGGDVKSTE